MELSHDLFFADNFMVIVGLFRYIHRFLTAKGINVPVAVFFK
jgi:hypothetical protein